MSSNNRQKENELILNNLAKLVAKYPDLRFHQLLAYTEINQQQIVLNNAGQNEFVIKDEFYIESNEILKRMRKE